MNRRTRARELALQLLFQNDLGSEDIEQTLSTLRKWAQPKDVEETLKFAERLIRTTIGYRAEIDEKIETLSEHWKLSRMSTVDRNVLRMAVAEILHCDDIPPKVSIDEAIELAKKFGDQDSGRFVNGVLDRLLGEVTGRQTEETSG